MSTYIENARRDHRHGQAWDEEREENIERDYQAIRWVVFGLVAFWALIILLLTRCAT